MEERKVKGNTGKHLRNNVKVVCNWSYRKETTSSFRRLMLRLLLSNRKGMNDENR